MQISKTKSMTIFLFCFVVWMFHVQKNCPNNILACCLTAVKLDFGRLSKWKKIFFLYVLAFYWTFLKSTDLLIPTYILYFKSVESLGFEKKNFSKFFDTSKMFQFLYHSSFVCFFFLYHPTWKHIPSDKFWDSPVNLYFTQKQFEKYFQILKKTTWRSVNLI